MKSQSYKYFMIPFDDVPRAATYTVWFATWSRDAGAITWSSERPASSSPLSRWAVGVVAHGALPPGATLLGTLIKDIPPPTFKLSSEPSGPAAVHDALTLWLTARSA